jgi:hypothetical protein
MPLSARQSTIFFKDEKKSPENVNRPSRRVYWLRAASATTIKLRTRA